jgi:hypothetical protein
MMRASLRRRGVTIDGFFYDGLTDHKLCMCVGVNSMVLQAGRKVTRRKLICGFLWE